MVCCAQLSFELVLLVFLSPSWFVAKIYGDYYGRGIGCGIWIACIRDPPNFFSFNDLIISGNCLWFYEPSQFVGYNLSGASVPTPIYTLIFTRVFYTLAFICNLSAYIQSLFLCFGGPDQARHFRRIEKIGKTLLAAGLFAAIAVIIFAVGLTEWISLLAHGSMSFGLALILAVFGVVFSILDGLMYWQESRNHKRRVQQLWNAQAPALA